MNSTPLEETFKSPSISSLTPTLAASATTTMVVASASNTSTPRSSMGSINHVFYKSPELSSIKMKGDERGERGEREENEEDPGIPIVIEHLQSTVMDNTNKNVKPVLLDPLGAGVVHSLE